jgi:hypothetical protein
MLHADRLRVVVPAVDEHDVEPLDAERVYGVHVLSKLAVRPIFPRLPTCTRTPHTAHTKSQRQEEGEDDEGVERT